MSLSVIRAALMTKLSTWANAQIPPIPIAREGTAFTKPASNGTFLEAIITPADTKLVTVSGDRQRFFGTFTINIWTQDTIGTGTAEGIAASLSTLFAPVPKTMLPVSVETPLTAKKAVLDGSGYRIVPCDLMYRLES